MSTPTLRSRYIVANGVRTHYTEAGDNGPVVVALHGGGAGSSGDAGMGGLLPQLAPHFRVVAIDGVGGFGYTDAAAPAPEGMRRMLGVLCARPEQITDALVESRYQSSVRPGAKEALAAFVAGHRYLQSDIMKSNFDMRTSLPELTKHIPTASVWGEEDALAPVKVGRQLQTLLPDVAWHYVPHAGHQVQTDQPEKLAQIILDISRETR
jgi:pimeloyl-ACP methyl ester carboxylesterase